MFPDKAPGGKYARIDARLVADAGRRRPRVAAEGTDTGKSWGNAYMPLDT